MIDLSLLNEDEVKDLKNLLLYGFCYGKTSPLSAEELSSISEFDNFFQRAIKKINKTK